MIKHELREMGFAVIDKNPKKFKINLLWLILTVVLIVGTILGANLFFQLTMGMDGRDLAEMRAEAAEQGATNPLSEFVNLITDYIGEGMLGIVVYVGIFVVVLLVYLALRLVMTIIVCNDKLNSIKLKMLNDKGMPVCFCKEALKVWQTVLIYIVPFILVYSFLFYVCISTIGDPFYMLLLVFMSFFMAFDLTVVIYTLLINIKEKMDYISVDHHVYNMTLFKQTYVSHNNKIPIKHIEHIEDSQKIEAFIQITSCTNLDCDNYRQELNENATVCPLCNKRTYTAVAMANMTTCVNDKCENYGEDLKKEVEVCGLCGERTGNLALKFNRNLTLMSIVMSAVFVVVFSLIYWYMSVINMTGGPLLTMLNLLLYGMTLINITVGYNSRNKIAMLIAVAAGIFTVGFSNFII